MTRVIGVQRRMMELGRIRLGEKGPKGEPRKLATFRFTSASKTLLEAVAERYGGNVTVWESAPDEGYYQVTTEAAEIDIVLPPVFSASDGTPTTPYSQFYELWSGGGCQRRCDGETEALSGKPCMCAIAVADKGEEARACKVTTRVSFMMPDIPGLGVWRLDSHGWNAAVELPGTLEVLLIAASEQKFIPAVLRAEQRTKKVPGEGTRKFVVPVIDLPQVTVRQLVSGDVPLAINPPVPPARRGERVALPSAGAELPADPVFANDRADSPGWGTPPEPETFADSGIPSLVTRLTLLAETLGAKDATVEAIGRNRDTNGTEEHKAWLERQIATAEKALEERAQSSFPIPDSVKVQV